MHRKYNILLVDDSVADNFLHSRIIRNTGRAESIAVANNGYEALDYLNSRPGNGTQRPDIIMLDINMPGMNGWEFLDEYVKLDAEKKARTIICMLTASNVDQAKIEQYGIVNGHIDKPLTTDKFLSIVSSLEE